MALSLISQLAHFEIKTPVPEESLDFWTDVIGLEETTREGQSVYLRGWGDRFHHTLVLTEGPEPALGHIGWRSFGEAELEEAAKRVQESGIEGEWIDSSVGHGRAFSYTGPGGHSHEIFWDVERYVAPAGKEPRFPNRPQQFVPRGVAARCIDHITVVTADPASDAKWYRDVLGHRFTEYTVIPERPDFIVFALTSTCERAHDMGLVWDPTGAAGRVNHVAYFVETGDNLHRAADVLLNQDVPIEFGPGKHGMGEQDYLYMREPSGLRVELNSGGWRNYEPDLETLRYEPQAGSNVFYKNLGMPDSMFESFPPVEIAEEDAAEAQKATGLFT